LVCLVPSIGVRSSCVVHTGSTATAGRSHRSSRSPVCRGRSSRLGAGVAGLGPRQPKYRPPSPEATQVSGGPRGDRTHNPRIKRARVQGPRVSADVRLCWSGGYPWPRGPPRTVMNVVRRPPRWHHPSHWPGASHTDHARCKTAPPRCCDRDEALIPHHPQERRETHLQRSTTERLSLGPPVPSSTCRTRSCTGGRDSPSGGSRAGQRSRGRLRTPHPRGPMRVHFARGLIPALRSSTPSLWGCPSGGRSPSPRTRGGPVALCRRTGYQGQGRCW
jgi:hypothetical protein